MNVGKNTDNGTVTDETRTPDKAVGDVTTRPPAQNSLKSSLLSVTHTAGAGRVRLARMRANSKPSQGRRLA
ncbi:hypothetical protein PsYK624_104110 [Phanerochaete sordida]|uniref:Uncharacterized protein n=1 Tax=Phanerochaete sordida TaxID=48140 RepID=A0A9P3LGV6_9APHY|nr:hypothetical protein PsYK624_104110 [Phanerochaete sordida]